MSATPVSRLAATVERLRREIQEANAAADGRALVELAKGVLVERLRCGPAQAARQLEVLAEQASVTPLELAAELVDQAAQDRVTEAVGEFLVRTTDKLAAVRLRTAEKRDAVVRLRTAESAVLAGGDTQRVAESVLAHAAGPLGATAVAIWSAATDSSLTLAGYAGIDPAEASRWRYVPPGVATPARRALTEREPVWIDDLATSGLPSVGPSGGRAVLPTVTGGRLLGVLEVCWPRPLEPQPQPVHRQLDALAELCGHALDADALAAVSRPDASELASLADGLFDSALVLRPHLDDTGALVDFRIAHLNPAFVDLTGRPRGLVSGALLLEAYPMAGAGHLFEKVEHVFATGETFRTERMTFTELVDQVPLTVVAAISISRHGDAVLVVWRVEDETARLATLLQHAQRLGRVGGFEENTATGEITWSSQLYALYGLAAGEDPVPLARLAEHAHEDDVPAIERFLRTVLRYRRAGSASFRLLRPDGVARHIRVVAEPVLDPAGHLLAVRGAFQDISAQHWTEVALSATRDRLAHTEQHVAEQQRLTVQLQQAIMPAAEPSIEAFGLRIAVRYRPSGGDHVVGGDWYDAVVLPSKQILLSVGDITGHGIKAATGMVVLRNALRGLAATGAGPGQMLAWLNLVAHHLTDHILATAVCGVYDPDTRVLRWARAGHPVPVLVRNGRAMALPLLSGVLLGALAEGTYEQGEVQLEPGDTLLLYTDGLIERRDVPLDECLDRLLAVSARFEGSLEDRLDDLLDGSDSNTDDDTCVVGLLVT
ncbi:SpoIIE family protein phosphatase [Saccharothrix variisporea]|uniref:PAS domain-containing protein n=1 Tax=Saccharothrix variisporea TaxID=543527 RepID=A0A495X046_9PSEU|nr:SpoIIE family protein phosphatase [Saccharothrix variisporea]RKT67187.1 PAS domain-containing protein [Saccharothrix variisporea]